MDHPRKSSPCLLWLFCAIVLTSSTISTARFSVSKTEENPKGKVQYEIPAMNGNEQVVVHFAYTLSYNEQHEQASWVAYMLTRDRVQSKVSSRSDNFREDPKVKTGSATITDYRKSGYDRGHLAPAADMAWSAQSMSESFFFSNMSPQTPSFNRGIWKKLEELVRDWALTYDTLYIATGPVLSDNLASIGPNHVSVPEYYYKAILRMNNGETQGIALLLPNLSTPQTAPLSSFVISIDQLEKMTGIDFFPALPDEVENKMEKSSCVSCWDW